MRKIVVKKLNLEEQKKKQCLNRINHQNKQNQSQLKQNNNIYIFFILNFFSSFHSLKKT